MAFLIDEQKFVEENIFKYENRLNTQVSRFLDKSPVFVTYYHINVNETTVDEGFKDIESILGDKSPLRFQKIENFPMYGLESVVLAIHDSDQGLDTEYEGECVILPNTIKPLQNDFFMIKHVQDSFIFRVTGINYDSIRPDNFYKISYRFEWLDCEKEESLNNQVEEKFTCILQNIGSENSCIIQEDYKNQLDKIEELYNDMVHTYKTIFYNKRYNCFLGDNGAGYKLYDPLQTMFFNRHKLLNKQNDYSTIILTEGFIDNRREIKYEKSIYRFFERRNLKLISRFPYTTFSAITKKDSIFSRWNDQSVLVVEIPQVNQTVGIVELLPHEIEMSFKVDGPTESKYVELMQKFIRNDTITLYDIPLDMNEELLQLDANAEVFFFTPILLYIVQTVVNDFLHQKE